MVKGVDNTGPIFSALQQARPADAERLCHAAMQVVPEDGDLLFLLALAQHQQHKLDQAIPNYAKLTKMFPDSAVHWGNYATALRDAGLLEPSAEACETALRLDPDNVDQLICRGLLQMLQKDFVGARSTLIKAVGLAPQSPAARIHAARACSICRDYRAEDLIRPWRDWLPLEESLQFELANLHVVLGEANTARLLLEDLVQRSPHMAGAQLLLAAVYERINRLDDAQQLLEQWAPRLDELDDAQQRDIQRQYATLAQRRGDPERARQILQQTGPRNELDYAYYFSLAEACDKSGAYAEAAQALSSAHALQVDELKLVVPFRLAPGAPPLPGAIARISSENYRRWPVLAAPDAANSPVFIVGFPRSGTTLLEQMLDAHPGLQSMDERPFFNILSDQLSDHDLVMPRDLHKLDQNLCDELRKGYLSLVCSKIKRRWDAQLVDKNPLNMLWLPFIHRLFPEAKFILALRDPRDVLLSNYMQNFRASVLAVACTSVERLARAYVAAMNSWLHHVEVIQPNLLISRYEDLIVDADAQTQRIADFLGLEDVTPLRRFDQHAREKGFIATPSYTQVIQPLNRKGMGRWRRYEEMMEPALPILKPMLEHWNYRD